MGNNVTLIPKQPARHSLLTNVENVVYMPLASRHSHGIVKIGDGLNVTADGLLSVDYTFDWFATIRTDVDLLKSGFDDIKNNMDDVLTNVSNASKKLSDIESGKVLIDIYQTKHDTNLVTVNKTVVGGINELINRTQINIENINAVELNIDKIKQDYATLKYVDNLYSTVSMGGHKSVVFETQQQFFDWLDGLFDRADGLTPDKLFLGDMILIVEQKVPDYWVKSKNTPMSLVDFAEYESKIDVPEVTVDFISINKNEKGELQAIALKDAFVDVGSRVSYSDFSGMTYLSEEQYQELITYGSIMVGDEIVNYDDGVIYITPQSTEGLVTTDTAQMITGPKTFLETIYLANQDGTVDRISHINNNFIIRSGAVNGSALLNIDEGLSKIYAFNKELAFKEDLTISGGGTVVYVGGVAKDSVSVDADIQTQLDTIASNVEEKASKTVVDQNTVDINSLESLVGVNTTDIGALRTSIEDCVKYSELVDTTNAVNPLENKANKDLSNVTYPEIVADGASKTGAGDRVVETYMSSNGLTWYRKWASGWKECGMTNQTTSSSGSQKLTLPIGFTTQNVTVTYSANNSSSLVTIKCKMTSDKGADDLYYNVNVATGSNSSTYASSTCCIYCCGY